MTTRAVRDNDLFNEITAILGKEYEIPNKQGYGGSGGPGRILEELLHVKVNNQDLPDAGRWELKYTSNVSYLTLFHKDPNPRKPSVVKDLVLNCGWDSNGKTSFRHTIWGVSPRGFRVEVSDEKISVVNDKYPNIVAYWDMDELLNSVIPKLRNLILVPGKIRKRNSGRWVTFNYAQANYGFGLSKFMSGLRDGWIAIDFDARTNPTSRSGSVSIRNHGTKFRINLKNLGRMYTESHSIIAGGIDKNT